MPGSNSNYIFRIAQSLSRTLYSVIDNMSLVKCGVFFGLGAILSYGFGFSCQITTLLIIATYLATGGWKFIWVVINTLPRDAKALKVLIKLKLATKNHIQNNITVPMIFTKTAKKHPSKPCLVSEEGTLTFEEVENLSNQIANYFYQAGYRKGDVVALCFTENRIQYVCYWLGLAKIGVVAALINYNQRDVALSHSINAADSKAIIFTPDLSDALADVASQIQNKVVFYCTGNMSPNQVLSPVMLQSELARSPTYPPPAVKVGYTEKLFYVFTSGTTGLPKAAIISHSRFYYMTVGATSLANMTEKDVVYDTLPLYHTAGGVVGVGSMIVLGCTLVVRKKFSASRFWEDCIQYNCTAAQYIGEICRYLLATPAKPTDNQHKVKVMFGNGLKPEIWKMFQDRFGVKQMGEFYGATEGNCNTMNPDNTIGAVGFTTMIAPFLYPITLIRFNKDTGEYLRDRNGICIKSKPGEPGELVGKIVKGDALREFDGYVNRQATDKKVCPDVFKKGDLAFLTGDVLIMDKFGYFYFQDRTGDTFRWRGENVSTYEVESIISHHIQLKDSVVYGVEVKGLEGKAGMATIVDEHKNLDLLSLTKALQKSLPPYARPVFIRLASEVDTTGTHKLKKVDLAKEGFNPNIIKDNLYYMNSKTQQYEPLTVQVYNDICSGKIRL
ncbi:solute carrier family 27 (fatty acid transporter), member 1/4 [Mytilus galloprovincialis]|uniref:Very long-chain fatty acid transport protein n=2 Tax=Mytilus galloprovincialis TaxID=29158 RepID=A0A8B6EA75_MYTGA|nr:solute carrier family 27 (fatty acid transporter), member 1/4 [Mytilus galloprovincialis]